MSQENVESQGFNLGDWPDLGTYKSGGFGGDWDKMKKLGLLRKSTVIYPSGKELGREVISNSSQGKKDNRDLSYDQISSLAEGDSLLDGGL
jgi:hypothetical protein